MCVCVCVNPFRCKGDKGMYCTVEMNVDNLRPVDVLKWELRTNPYAADKVEREWEERTVLNFKCWQEIVLG